MSESKGDLVLIVDGSIPQRDAKRALTALQERGYWVMLIIVDSPDRPFTLQDLTRLEPADKQEIIHLVEKAIHVSV